MNIAKNTKYHDIEDSFLYAKRIDLSLTTPDKRIVTIANDLYAALHLDCKSAPRNQDEYIDAFKIIIIFK